MRYEPIVLEKWLVADWTHRLIVTMRGNIEMQSIGRFGWERCRYTPCIPIFRRPRARK